MPTISLTVDAQNAQRILTGVGRYLHLQNPDGTPRDATLPEVKDFIAGHLRAVVRDTDQLVARAQADASVTDIAVT